MKNPVLIPIKKAMTATAEGENYWRVEATGVVDTQHIFGRMDDDWYVQPNIEGADSSHYGDGAECLVEDGRYTHLTPAYYHVDLKKKTRR